MIDYAALRKVHSDVNSVPYVADDPYFDDWSPDAKPTGKDCDSYAVEKLRRLVALGMDIKSLRLATCAVRVKPCDHCVLIASLDDGDYMLSNGLPLPVPMGEFNDLGWTRDRIQKVGGEQGWAKWLDPGAD
jgi:predicted transglutaminase-like cysteine proteinase